MNPLLIALGLQVFLSVWYSVVVIFIIVIIVANLKKVSSVCSSPTLVDSYTFFAAVLLYWVSKPSWHCYQFLFGKLTRPKRRPLSDFAYHSQKSVSSVQGALSGWLVCQRGKGNSPAVVTLQQKMQLIRSRSRCAVSSTRAVFYMVYVLVCQG